MTTLDRAYEDEEERRIAEWRLGDYVAEDCEQCGRQRVCKCSNGKHRCEKCNCVPRRSGTWTTKATDGSDSEELRRVPLL